MRCVGGNELGKQKEHISNEQLNTPEFYVENLNWKKPQSHTNSLYLREMTEEKTTVTHKFTIFERDDRRRGLNDGDDSSPCIEKIRVKPSTCPCHIS